MSERRGVSPAPVGMVLGAVASVQFGAGLAATLFADLGPIGTVLLRVGFAAVVLVAIWRPRMRGLTREQWWLIAAFGVSLAAMNGLYYLAIDRIPQGVAVTFEFVGPLGVALAASRERLDVLWAVLAAAGVVLLGGFGSSLDAAGVAFALGAGASWAAYILLNARVGRTFRGGDGLALAMVAGTAVLVVPGVADAGAALLDPELLALGAAVALLSSVIPYSLELEALRRIPARVFGVLEALLIAGLAVLAFGAAQPTNDLTQTIPVSVAAIRDLVDADLTAAGINDCGLGPLQVSSTTVWTATGSCSENSTLTLTIDRGFVFNSGAQGSPGPLKIIATHVDISYPYQWHFNSVIKLIAPNSTAAGTTQIDTDAIAANQD